MDGQLDVYNHQADIKQASITHGLDHMKHRDHMDLEWSSIWFDIHKHENPYKEPLPRGFSWNKPHLYDYFIL